MPGRPPQIYARALLSYGLVDAGKLKSSCICGNVLPYLQCCGQYAQPPEAEGESPDGWKRFRHALHELYMYLFPLRNLYQAYWERLSHEDYPHHLLMADPEYARAVVANFFWDYSVQFSDARPILRAARDIEGKDLRSANDFRQWGLAPAWPYLVVESGAQNGYVRMLGSEKLQRVVHGGELSAPGSYIVARILPFRGEEYLHPALLVFPGEVSEPARMEAKLRELCLALGVKSGAGLRPDVQCEEWRQHGARFLSWWRGCVYDVVVGTPARTVSVSPAFSLPGGDLESTAQRLEGAGVAVLGKGRFELRYRALAVARLEMREKNLQIVLLDPAFRAYVLRWLADHLGASEEPQEVRLEGEADSPSTLDAWMHTAHSELNGQTPIQASMHEFGRRKLQYLLRDLGQRGRDVSALRRQLGL